jgi:dienelactone hydrolase
MLALDYLRARPDVDTTRMEAVGVSLGAPFVTIAGALDRRFTRVWAIHGSGGSYAPLEMNMRQTIPFAPLRAVAAGLADMLISGPRLAPERWVARIAPRPFVMVNAEGDERLPRRSIVQLYERARQPKELVWLPGGHVRADTAVVRALAAIVLARIREGR